MLFDRRRFYGRLRSRHVRGLIVIGCHHRWRFPRDVEVDFLLVSTGLQRSVFVKNEVHTVVDRRPSIRTQVNDVLTRIIRGAQIDDIFAAIRRSTEIHVQRAGFVHVGFE